MLERGRQRTAAIGPEAAAALGVDLLGYLATEPDRISRFMALSGLEAHELRSAAGDPSFFVGLFDFVLADERMLLDFAADRGIAPESIGAARQALGGRRAAFE